MTILCVNCGAPAEYYVSDPGVNPLDYCSQHLPDQWRNRVLAGQLARSQKVAPAVRAADNAPFGEFGIDQAVIAARFAVPAAAPARGRARA